MKICAAICEYNPLHNGHLKHLQYIKQVIKPDYTIIILSGNFTQRGEIAVCDKYTRATWAIQAGADAVIELPTVFATSTAELFASGAIKLINALPYEKSVCFGVETNNVENLKDLASLLINETDDMKAIIKSELLKGESLLKARYTAVKECAKNVDTTLLEKPNNVLGLEYVKAIVKNNYDINIQTLCREGGDYNNSEMLENLSSAFAIRTAISENNLDKIASNIPSYVLNDLPTILPNFDKEIMYALLTTNKEFIASTLECAEGLENRIKTLVEDSLSVSELLNQLKTKRYTDARLRRILLSTTLKISGDFVKQCLNSSLYLKVLAINKNTPEILSVLANSNYPVITRKSDALSLTCIAKQCFEKDALACNLYSLESKSKLNEYQMKIV